MRSHNRKNHELRPLEIISDFNLHAEGSVLIKSGNTHVLCTASIDETVPKWLQDKGQGWITAEYAMLPRSTHSRIKREKGQTSGRVQEISRLIARSLRQAVNLKALNEKQIYVDCDVLQADGGTRTASITGGFVALALALRWGQEQGLFMINPLVQKVAAVSLGILDDNVLLDLDYEEDSQVETDMNVVINENNEFIEIQGTAEKKSFSKNKLLSLLETAQIACQKLFVAQQKVLDFPK